MQCWSGEMSGGARVFNIPVKVKIITVLDETIGSGICLEYREAGREKATETS